MPTHIVLARHGAPDANADDRRAISGRELGRWYRRYNELGIATTSDPPPPLRVAAASAGCVIASDLRRARESAARLTSADRIRIEPALREVGFPEAFDLAVRLHPAAWVAIARVAWLLDRCDSEETLSATRQRAARAADRLCVLAQAHNSVLAVGHGWFNLFIAAELRLRGWRGPRVMASGYWSSARFTL